ncbi:alpha-ketoglutarate-dependent dioxygenase AlkB family protein [Nonlabens xiamenensis]|uniref:alpha-ketoglutarate-dependent dioxygenase AlkB family protein n=1 Tax=Nonlabens xiamenensis TaxID=2341043 RepID=UPI000F609FE2|nr:alpha-ketoglutarate-dependent dioxygenase AlkB [Nonlabens xiamenensis]
MHNKLFLPEFPNIPDATVIYTPGFYAFAKAEQLKNLLLKETPWRQNQIKLFGKTHLEPRLTQLYGDPSTQYSYSGIQFEALEWTDTLAAIKKDVEKATGDQYNVCLLNQYRDGADSNGWHADNEAELGVNPSIASLSLGATRNFHLRHHSNKEWRFKFELEHGSLLVMKDQTQHTYQHQIAKTKKQVGLRINLTFRKTLKDAT